MKRESESNLTGDSLKKKRNKIVNVAEYGFSNWRY